LVIWSTMTFRTPHAESRGSASPVWPAPDAWHALVAIFISYEFNVINA
jgi:hypothetical protein